ncbi:hypothetical protein MMC07_001296 [Pseudocyphellaria aurata]|nr:hypothetical protein [Pseudocyphellaria aurata]
MFSGIQKPGKKFKHKAFHNKVAKRYDSELTVKSKVVAFCLLTGWHNAQHTNAKHIVPRALSSAELSYLFGVDGEVVSTDSRNALIVHASIEEALDLGDIVIVPCLTPKDVLTNSKLILTNGSISDQCAVANGENLWTWDELDGKTLEFRNDVRPARRYLYFRFSITDDQGRIWVTPGQYLRKSMLQGLAKHIIYHFLPDPIIGNSTFETVLESPSRPIEELLMAVQLGPIGKLHDIVIWIMGSPQRIQAFKKRSGGLVPHRDNKTRWNSWYNMLDWAMNKIKPSIIPVSSEEAGLAQDVLTAEEWKTQGHIRNFLRSFFDATKATEGRSAGLDELLPTMDFMTERFEEAIDRFDLKVMRLR